MKKLLLLALSLVLLVPSALAQTREGTVMLEGEAEPLVETLYQGEQGFYFWYDAEELEVRNDLSERGDSLMLSPTQNDLPIYLEILAPDAVGMMPLDFLKVNAAPDTEYVRETTEAGAELIWFSKPADYNQEIMQTYYAVQGTDAYLAAIATCPMEAMEGWGARFRHLMGTVGFGRFQAGPVRALWEKEAGLTPGAQETVALYQEEDAPVVVFLADAAVSAFEITELSLLDIGDDGRISFDEQMIYTQAALLPGQPLKVKLAFYGDVPNNGIRFIDAEGVSHRCALSISGLDGALELTGY